MREANTNTPARFNLPGGSCDAHFHVFEPGYPSIPEPFYSFPEGTIAQYLALAGFFGIDRMVLVQPTYYGTDNSLTIEALRRLGPRARGVVRVEEDVSEATLDAFHKAGVRAFRLDLFERSEQPVGETAAYVRRMAKRATARGWHVQFYSPGTVIRDLLPFLAELEDVFVIDHMGYMIESEGATEADFERLLDVLRLGSCYVKLSGAYRIARDEPLPVVEPLGRALVRTRPDRLIWGSDWPHLTNGQRDTGEVLNLLADWAPDPADRRRILVEAPGRLFFDE
jgi:predicted TIM-barrel fold metal-dependent hydrolase